MKIFVFTGVLGFFQILFSASFYGHLKEVVNASYLVFFNKEWGYVDCRMWGIQSPANVTKGQCDVDDWEMVRMGFYSDLQATRLLHLEQVYRVEFAGGRCILYNGAHIYNIQILDQGYAYLSREGLKNVKNKLLINQLQKAARKSKYRNSGLWNDWKNELKCLEQEEQQRSAGL